MWIKNAWYVAGFSDEVKQGSLLARTFLNQPVVLYRTAAGEPVALADRCPHRGVPLSLGKLIDDAVRCTYHGIRIGPDGNCKHIPCQSNIPAQAKAQTFPSVDRYKFTWIWLGDKSKADPALIPNVRWMNDPEWEACSGYHRIEADYQLMNDNLLDLSHESYLHERTIGNEAVAEAPVSCTFNDSEVRVHRDILNCDPPPFYVKATGFNEPIHRWHTTIFTPPGFNLIENGSYPVRGSKADALERRVIHLVTPESETATHYFWGIARQYQRDDADLTEFIRQQSSNTFDEDKAMLQVQQKALDALGSEGSSSFPVALKTDVGPIQARRLIQRLIAKENAAAAAGRAAQRLEQGTT